MTEFGDTRGLFLGDTLVAEFGDTLGLFLGVSFMTVGVERTFSATLGRGQEPKGKRKVKEEDEGMNLMAIYV